MKEPALGGNEVLLADFAEEDLGFESQGVRSIHIAGGKGGARLLEELFDLRYGLLFLIGQGAIDVFQPALSGRD